MCEGLPVEQLEQVGRTLTGYYAFTSDIGTNRTCRDVYYLVAFGGKPDISQRFAEQSRFMSARLVQRHLP